MIRDKLKEKKYFDALIEKHYESFNRRNNKLQKGLIKHERIKVVKKSLSDSYINLLKAKYSRGDKLSVSIIEDYKNAALLMKEYWYEGHLGVNFYIKNRKPVYLNQYTLTNFFNILDMLSIGVLIDEIDINSFNLVVDFIDKDEVKDFLFEFLICEKINNRNHIDEESYKELFYINNRLGRLKTIITENNKEIAQRELKLFLENDWYQSFKDTPIYNQHLNPHNTYVGYWCFVAAAIVKIKKLDDSSFRDNQYYPKDLIKNSKLEN